MARQASSRARRRRRWTGIVLLPLLSITALPRAHAQSGAGAQPAAAPATEPGRPYLEAALGAGRWLRSVAVEADGGLAWPAAPELGKDSFDNLYAGNSGPVLFLAELARATGDASWLADARRGADRLLATLPAELDPEGGASFYVGVAGTGFVFLEMWKATGDERYREGARRVLALVTAAAKPAGAGVEWSEVADVIGGSAGTGLYLLHAARELRDPQALELAAAAGRRLLELARVENVGLSWEMMPGFERVMPNFSHGTAGIAYFLASLYLETHDRRFLNAALAGGRHLKAISRVENGACLVPHHFPGGEQLYYLSWCHGPAGTGRLYYRLHQATGDRRWLDWLDRSVAGIEGSGIPEKRTEGFWENVSRCCGDAGVGDFLLALDRRRGEARHRPFVERLAQDLLARATPEPSGLRPGGGLKWVQAEHRVRPELLLAQTGLMQGASGIGLFFLRLDAFDQGASPVVELPDSPF